MGHRKAELGGNRLKFGLLYYLAQIKALPLQTHHACVPEAFPYYFPPYPDHLYDRAEVRTPCTNPW